MFSYLAIVKSTTVYTLIDHGRKGYVTLYRSISDVETGVEQRGTPQRFKDAQQFSIGFGMCLYW